MIEAASKMYTQPEVPFEATRWEINGKTVLEIYIAPSADKPLWRLIKRISIKPNIRVADENILANEIWFFRGEEAPERRDTGEDQQAGRAPVLLPGAISLYQCRSALPYWPCKLLHGQKYSERFAGDRCPAISGR